MLPEEHQKCPLTATAACRYVPSMSVLGGEDLCCISDCPDHRAETSGQRLVRRLRGTATGQDVAGMSTDEIMALLRGE
jgi:hypothetical protein